MGEIVKTGARALTVLDTLTTYELGAPIPKAVQEFVIKHFVLPVLLKYEGGRGLPDHEKPMILAEYAEDCVGFMPEAYRLAVKLMGRDRNKGNWRPDPGECRYWLQKAEDEFCARTGKPKQVRDQGGLMRVMLGALCGVGGENVETDEPGGTKKVRWEAFPTTWDRARLGPMPTEPGCRLDAAVQRECWVTYFRFNQVWYEHELAGSIDGNRVEPLPREASLRQKAKRLEAFGIAVAPPTCAILRSVMAERKVPMTAEEIAAADAEIADYDARVEAREAEEKARQRLQDEQRAADHREWVAAQKAETERKRRKALELLAAEAATLLPEMVEALKVFRATGGDAAFDSYTLALRAAEARELERMLADPAYVDECNQKIAARKAADAALSKEAWRAETEARRRRAEEAAAGHLRIDAAG